MAHSTLRQGSGSSAYQDYMNSNGFSWYLKHDVLDDQMKGMIIRLPPSLAENMEKLEKFVAARHHELWKKKEKQDREWQKHKQHLDALKQRVKQVTAENIQYHHDPLMICGEVIKAGFQRGEALDAIGTFLASPEGEELVRKHKEQEERILKEAQSRLQELTAFVIVKRIEDKGRSDLRKMKKNISLMRDEKDRIEQDVRRQLSKEYLDRLKDHEIRETVKDSFENMMGKLTDEEDFLPKINFNNLLTIIRWMIEIFDQTT